MTKRMFASALFAGLAVGLISAALQFLFVTPLLLEGELYESGARLHFASNGSPQSEAGAPAYTREHMRHLLTISFNILAYTGFALLLVAGFAIAETRALNISASDGVLWGLIGFASLHLAPAFGLAPELPGTVGAVLEDRQIWWIATVLATAGGLICAMVIKSPWAKLGAALIIAAPHVFGAPHLDTYYGVAPPELSALFATRSLGVAAISWVLLGSLAGHFWSRQKTA
ncbi:MAG: CbtA family protein [Paracoccaceae bacterium]